MKRNTTPDSQNDYGLTENAKQSDQAELEVRISFRWGKDQIDLIKSVSELIGIPYQTYIKSALYKQACQDFQLLTGEKPSHKR